MGVASGEKGILSIAPIEMQFRKEPLSFRTWSFHKMSRALPVWLVVAGAVLQVTAASAEPLSHSSRSLDCSISHPAPFAASWLLPASLSGYSPNGTTVCPDHRIAFVLVLQDPAGGAKDQTDKAASQLKRPIVEHHFWDGKNVLLFAAVGASRALDYSSTLNFRRRGRNEALLTNDIVDNHAAFAAIEAGATAASIGVSYLFHHYHHHRLERWTSIVHASLATGGAIRNYSLQTVH
jgi:hypothetical protein